MGTLEQILEEAGYSRSKQKLAPKFVSLQRMSRTCHRRFASRPFLTVLPATGTPMPCISAGQLYYWQKP